MKNVFSFMLIIFLSIGISGCANSASLLNKVENGIKVANAAVEIQKIGEKNNINYVVNDPDIQASYCAGVKSAKYYAKKYLENIKNDPKEIQRKKINRLENIMAKLQYLKNTECQ